MSRQHGNPEGIPVKIVPYISPWIECWRLEQKVKQMTGKSDLSTLGKDINKL